MRTNCSRIAAAGIAAFLMQAGPAGAQTFMVTYVTAGGGSSNCGSPGSACGDFISAINATAPGGRVVVLTPGSYGAIYANSSLAIIAAGDAVASGISQGTMGIPVFPGSGDIVTLRGIVLDQTGQPADRRGVVHARGTLHMENCVVRGLPNAFGIEIVPDSAGTKEAHISNCTVSGNGLGGAGGGILVKPTGPSNGIKVFLDNVRVENNRVGIVVDRSQTTGVVQVVMRNSKVVGNDGRGVVSRGTGSIVRISDSTISGNGIGLSAIAGGQLISHGGNLVSGNDVDRNFTSTEAPK
jgi:hypothetical protein